MSELMMIGRNTATTANETVTVQIQPVAAAPVETYEANVAVDAAYDAAIDNSVSDDEVVMDTPEDLEGEGFEGDTGENYSEDEMIMEPSVDDGAYIDPGFIDGGYVDPGFYYVGYM
jgi:preprotein translocase subunit Sec63